MPSRLAVLALISMTILRSAQAQDAPARSAGPDGGEAGASSAPSERRAAELRRTIEKRNERRDRGRENLARQKAAIRQRTAAEAEAARRANVRPIAPMASALGIPFLPAPLLTAQASPFRVTGRLVTGVVAIGAETTGTTVQAADGLLYELDLSGLAGGAARASSLSGRSVIASGLLVVRAGIEVGMRRILTVTDLREDAAVPDVTRAAGPAPAPPQNSPPPHASPPAPAPRGKVEAHTRGPTDRAKP